ncbi:aldehyde dehydrogenase [Nocardiopsis gilva YIM 90087]|uniref:Aldehyde dehydrogenase n=1 Tax=Nocardiopsis gilva YIM 90087 TaxID=1235441 RepID=A0A223SCD4_9ACTN|nr:aldehyde dehydrogenase family protein [Nocardiopsis gilva]ASU85831.1 aldehyde dehydrogenase [Nocardiopsis gilva YIM 90087]
MSEPIQLDALGPTGPYRARSRLTVTDVAGQPIAELSQVPRLYVNRTIGALRKGPTLSADQRAAALAEAGRAFASSTIAGMSVEEYEHYVSRVAGMPLAGVRTATQRTAQAAVEAYRSTRFARPEGAVEDWRDPMTRTGRAVWTRRGDVFAVLAPANHPGVHSLWLEALALGYRVVVRPSRREPFTPYRLVAALRETAFGDDAVALLPTDYAGADDIVSASDLTMVYGGDEVVEKYAADPTVLPQGPGRSKILLSGDDWRSHLDTVVDSVALHGGTGCINTTAVFVDGDPAPVAEALAERLSAIPSRRPEAEDAALPVQPADTAATIEKYLFDRAEGARTVLGGDGVADDLGDGSAALRPAVFQVDSPDAPQLNVELGFPCVWVAPWSPSDGVAPLRNTLVLTAIGAAEELVDRLVEEPTISNVYLGDHPTHWLEPGIPHDRYLAEFLMRTKAVIRG